jgi:lysophospholipase
LADGATAHSATAPETSTEDAPYHANLAALPGAPSASVTGQAHFLRTEDGVRIRVAYWGQDASAGTVLLFPGRTECVEKYGPTAADLHKRGFATLAIDWRGQGLSDRLLPNPLLGHVNSFADYQRDAAAMMAHARRLNLPQPYFLLAHSMGGCIGLRSVINWLPVRAAAFTAPMWGILMKRRLRPVAWGLSSVAGPLRFGHMIAPGQDLEPYLRNGPFDGNTLTSDPEMFAFMQAQIRGAPAMALGGPTLRWLNAALRETRALAALSAPALPALTFLGTEELIIDPSRIHQRMEGWPDGRLHMITGARHEVLMETPAIRANVLDTIVTLFRGHTGDQP